MMVTVASFDVLLLPGEPINLMANSAREEEVNWPSACLISNVVECLLTLITLSVRAALQIFSVEWPVLQVCLSIFPLLFPNSS